VVEVGGGTGVITSELARAGASVCVVERDPALAEVLHARFDPNPAVEVVLADALEYAWPDEAFSVVANLPFVRSGAILASLLRDPDLPLRSAHVIVQWEFAAKHAAVWPATQRSTYWRAWYDVSIVRRLDRTAFAPPPSVDAAVLRFERRSRVRVPHALHEAYWRFLSDGFSSQEPIRRGLRATLTPLQVKRLAPALGFGPATRSRDLDAEQWARLFAAARA
jgi:16S rRNA A1518/A1519 N6-dimethyltransferase RsmA/KsgA/DIM1 with predicted DNA glycosylase/AP lyase activity